MMIIKKAVLCNASLFFIEYLIQIIPPITVKILILSVLSDDYGCYMKIKRLQAI